MASTRVNLRQAPVGSAAWISEERNSAQQWADTEAEGFTFAAHNEMEWLNEHMSEIFSKNESKFADIFKTPGKLRGKTPRTARKLNPWKPESKLHEAAPAHSGRHSLNGQISTFRVAEDEPVKHQPAPLTKHASPRRPINTLDSGYHGSQSDDGTEVNDQDYEQEAHQSSPRVSPAKSPGRPLARSPDEHQSRTSEVSEERRTTEGSFESAREEPTKVLGEEAEGEVERGEEMETESTTEEPAMVSYPVLESPIQSRIPRCSTPRSPSPQKRSPQRPVIAARSPSKAPSKSPSKSPMKQTAHPNQELEVDGEDEHMEDVQSPSDASSPIRPIVRKSSLNFASLPAREPITTKKSIGNRASRTSHLDQTRTSYYGRQTGGKSLGNARPEKDDDDEMDVDSAEDNKKSNEETNWARLHNKTSTQRLQDQISMLGQSQSNFRPHSKSIASNSLAIAQASQSTQPSQETQQQKSPLRKDRSFVAPGAFPEDEDESWIGPPTTGAAVAGPSIFSPRPQLAKSYTADVMESIHGKDSIGGTQFTVPKRGSPMRQISPIREPVADTSMSPLRHIKSVSASFLRSPKKSDDSISLNSVKKGISVSNPNPSTSSLEESTTPPKSPSRSRGSPLKAAKDKFSSILKTSRGLFASSAAVSAEAKNAALSPGYERPHTTSSMDEVFEDGKELTYPSLENHMNDAPQQTPASPTKSPRRTRASTEREEKRKEDAKEAKRILDQLEKARMKVQEEARQHRLEQERVMAMEKQILARKEQENLAKSSQVDVPRATRSSPRKTKAQLEAEGIAASAAHTEDMASNDTELGNAPVAMPPPSIPRPKSQIGRPGVKRPLKPTKDTLPKTKAPTVIRVDTGSQRGHQYHPSTASLASSLQDSLPASTTTSQSTLRNKQSTASNASFQSKSSTSSFKSTASKALEAAAKKKEQDELVAQRKREAKMEIERQRAAIKEEERRQKEQDRRQEAERQRELQREKEQALMTAEAKRQANRQAMDKKRMEMEKAKQTRAPPPASRNQPSTDISRAALQDKALPPIPPQRGDLGRSVNANIHNTSKAPPKRPLQQDNGDDHHSRPQLIRNGPSYQQNQADSKRRKTSDAFDDDDTTENQPRMMAPPIRQSSVRQKEMPTKSLFPSGYANAPPPASSLPRNTLISQHNGNPSKPAHPMDMTQVSKATINFAPSSSQPSTQSHKTPARPPGTAGSSKSHAKSAAKSSPRYQNGESIDLPEIHTDSEDEDEDEKDEFAAPGWTNSPLLKKQLIKQETIDPMDVFGPPGPLIMEEVFSKNKERFPNSEQGLQVPTGRDRTVSPKMRLEGIWRPGTV